jgi:hypothetical protein
VVGCRMAARNREGAAAAEDERTDQPARGSAVSAVGPADYLVWTPPQTGMMIV